MNDTESKVSENSKVESTINEQTTTSPTKHSKQVTRNKLLPIDSIQQLISRIYAGEFNRTKLRKADMDRIRAKSALTCDEINNLVELSSEDRLLKNTIKLVTIGVMAESLTVKEQIAKFVHKKLKHHPAFRGLMLSGQPDNVIHAIANFKRYENSSWPDDYKKLSRRDKKTCMVNSINCFLLWLWINDKIPLERVQEYLLRYRWKPAATRVKYDAEKVLLVTGARDSETIAISIDASSRDAVIQKERAEIAEIENKGLLNQISSLKVDLDNVQKMLLDTQKEVDLLNKELLRESQEHANDNAHFRDDYESLRGRVLRRMNAELVLLEQGLHALRRDPPKINVMADHAERAVDGLKAECERLKKRAGSEN